MKRSNKNSASSSKEFRYGIHTAAACLALALLVCAIAVLFPRFGIAGRSANGAQVPTPAPVTSDPGETPDASLSTASPAPATALPSETPEAATDAPVTPDPAEYVKTRIVIDGVPFASLASRQAAEEVVNTVVSHFELLCPGTGLVTSIENSIGFEDASSSDGIVSFDEAFSMLIGEETPLRVRTVFTRSDLEALPCSSVEQPSGEHYVGTRFVASYGRDGKKMLLNEYTYINGVLSAFTQLEDSVLSEPVDELVLIGTRPIPTDGEPALDFGFSECPPTNLSFTAPVDAEVAQFFGFYNGELSRGIRFNCASGEQCHAPCGGTVSAVLLRGSLGLTVEISHGGGIVTRYANLQSADVSLGDALLMGDVIGRSGEGGLHFEFLVGGKPFNPLYYLTMPGSAALD
ncbi:MAG: peptidoglycan DD-metalloendopeptidase family protein [Clostridia bacterium]|nr:peptidoglycan DD-metalloendopeptidase family protein [Clostridia bacterium]